MVPENISDVVRLNRRGVLKEFLKLKVKELTHGLGPIVILMLGSLVVTPVVLGALWVLGATVLGLIVWVFPDILLNVDPADYVVGPSIFGFAVVLLVVVSVTGYQSFTRWISNNWEQAKSNVYWRMRNTPTAP